jgi:mutator protein MutT
MSQKFAQKALVVNDKNELLLIHYANAKYRPGHLNQRYALPGGKIEMGENPDESMVSEVKEETGITCTPGVPFYTWNWEYKKGDEDIQINAVMRYASYKEGIVNKGEKEEVELTIDEVCWVPLSKVSSLELVENEKPGIEFFIKNYQSLKKLSKKED